MIDASLLTITSEDTKKLHGLMLRAAFAIHVMRWKWYKRPDDGYPYILMDEKPEKTRSLNEDIAYYIGDNRFIFKNIPEYDLNYKLMNIICKNVIILNYGDQLEIEMAKVINSHKHLDFIMCSPEHKCRAVLNTYLTIHKQKLMQYNADLQRIKQD